MRLRYNDEHHAYWLDGKRCKGVTTVAKIPDDTYRLEQWAKRQVAIGLASTPVLIEAVAAHFDDRQKIDDYCDQAMEAAKAHTGATRGTAAHRITERHDLGEPIMDTPLSAYVVASWQAALEAAGLEVVTDYIERIVVYPDRFIAGRFDRLCRRRSDGRLVVVDVKGGQRAIEYPHSIAVQMALYANAPLLAGPVPANGGETDLFEAMPDVDREWGYIFHLPEEGDAAVAKVDIAAGWTITRRAIFPVFDWRARRDLCAPVATIAGGEVSSPVPTPGSSTIAPSPPAAADIDKLRARYNRLSEQRRIWVLNLGGALVSDERSYQLGLALVRFAELDVDDDILRAAYTKACGRKLSIRKKLADHLAKASIDECQALSQIAIAIHNGEYAIRYTDDGVRLDAA
jgi:hypothetical protein